MSWGLGWKRPTEVFHLTLSYGADADSLDDPNTTPPGSSSASSSFSGSSPPPSFLDGGGGGGGANTTNNPDQLGFRIDLDWNAGDDEDQVALKLQSQVMIALPTPQDTVEIEFTEKIDNVEGDLGNVDDGGEGNLENNEGEGNLGNIEDGGEGKLENNEGEGDLGNEREKVVEVGVEMRVVKRREQLKGVLMWKAGGSGQQNDGGMGVLVKLMRSNFAKEVAEGAAVASGCAEHWRNVVVVSLCGLGLTVSTLFDERIGM